MLYTEEAVKANIRNRAGKRVFYLGRADTLTPGARDWLRQQRVEILSADQARPERYRLLGGGYWEEKPEHLTHLNGEVLVSKCHPRIIFRGAMDSLEAEILLTQLAVDENTRGQLQQILELARNIIRWDVLEEPVAQAPLCGMEEGEIRERSHRPQEFYGQSHFMPEFSDGAAVLWLNRVRCAVREAELKAVAAFSDREGNPTRVDILRAMNRMSSMVYLLMIQEKAGRKNG